MSIYDTLNKEQGEAVRHTEGPVLILAGAGSGKTRVITHRVAYLIDECGVNPWNILAITFTNKAAGEMRTRVDDLVGYGAESVWISTFHSLCVRILRRYIDLMGYENSFTIYDTDDQKTLMKDVCKYLKIDTKDLRERDILSEISSAKNELMTPLRFREEMVGLSFRYKKIADAYEEYQKRLRKNNAVDFDDLLMLTVQLFHSHDEVLDYYQNRFRYIMVDEYQDTNRLQERILFDLRQENRNLVVVGDDYQSIYAFRGADINNILEFPNRVRKCDDIVHIGTNYRSGLEICDFANAVMEEHASFGYPKKMRATRWSDRQPMVVRPSDEDEESQWVFDEMRRLHDEEGLRWKDMAVLARTGRDTFRLENLLNSAGIAYEKYGGLKFLEYRCVLDVIAFMRVMSKPDDELSWFRILVLYPGIGERYARLITERMERDAAGDPNAFLLDRQWARRKFGKELEMLHDELSLLSRMEFDELPSAIVRYYVDLRKRVIQSGTYDDEANRTEDLEKLDEDASSLEALVAMAGGYKSTNEFLDAIVLDSLPKTPTQAKAMASDGGSSDMAVLSTIHSIKGLEFPAVFVLDCVDGKFPRSRGNGEADDDEMEDLRCFYVAITRAKDWLYVMAPRLSRRYDGTTERSALTHFLDGVDEDLYHMESEGDYDDSPKAEWDDWDGFGIRF